MQPVSTEIGVDIADSTDKQTHTVTDATHHQTHALAGTGVDIPSPGLPTILVVHIEQSV